MWTKRGQAAEGVAPEPNIARFKVRGMNFDAERSTLRSPGVLGAPMNRAMFRLGGAAGVPPSKWAKNTADSPRYC